MTASGVGHRAGSTPAGDDGTPGTPDEPPTRRRGGGHRAEVPRSRRIAQRLLVGLVVLLLVVGAGTAAVLTAPGLARRLGLPVSAAVDPPAPVAFVPQLGPLPAGAPTPTAAGVAGVLDGRVAGLGDLTGVVVDPAHPQQPLWQRNPAEPQVPASSTKLLTTSAALLSLDPETRFTTTVVAGPTPDSVVLVGGGDPTLSSLPDGRDSVYPGAAHLDDLVAQVRAARGTAPLSTVYVDDSRYSGPLLAAGWDPADIAGGNLTPMVPAMLDGGRLDPTALDGARTATPTEDVGHALGQRLGAAVQVEQGSGPANARVLGTVQSPPLTELIHTALTNSDNVLAEAIGREVARKAGAPASFDGAASSVTKTLAAHGVDVSSVTLSDTSGLSTNDRIPASVLASVLTPAAAPLGADPRTPALRPVLDGLPIAAGTGTLVDRFTPDTPNGDARGYVRAKTGTLTGTNALAGVVPDDDGRLLVFAFMSNGPDPVGARPRLDALAAALRGCGCR
ncbi:D-alanyl-D-alanine carboxypeptidase/D-alanyl-D-alanine-endopeptidase [Actinomycetospora sp. TBRC 11914]|uniref:D-alanyl-D-alanine carboxypeptidase/D-alanyl-D-alanine endopeptidase n=1 Tax=Actinomycetospora sp. TBRC 11914 TaxID=2729387 RepID=UPI00145F32F8|nr:D-alanyl-D-alanine carboxypeptidase/D-alanyl-D-alanine-endopeptidase [Actinomycetospora sp. TBRC 11914]NMO89121.1 D-alanyl-D-alanine carboxypeptidase/D-alanyl-D-alanine-endopeptidase [Actinomycetospora sp. TBRC 11914]